jgi:hypothetical protein
MRLAVQLSATLPDESFLDFGDAGHGYLFICSSSCAPRGAAFLCQF